jgi:hypothetical protein
MARGMLSIFQEAFGLTCNMAKCRMAPIRCNSQQIQLAATVFPCQVVTFLVMYLGIPLSVSKLLWSALISLLDRAANKLPTWKGRLMHQSGNQINVVGNTNLLLHRLWMAAMDDQVDAQAHERFSLVRNGHRTKW